jgi:glycogen operon protein
MYLAGAAIDDVGRHGRPIDDDDFLVLFNAAAEDLPFMVPAMPGEDWQPVIDTFEGLAGPALRRVSAGQSLTVRARSLVVLTRPMTTG